MLPQPTLNFKWHVWYRAEGKAQGTQGTRDTQNTARHGFVKAHAAEYHIGTRQVSHRAENRADEKILLRMLKVKAEKERLTCYASTRCP